ncbi:MAG: hypothetical protein ABL934_02920 [Lysobacteraceae bacterium]
MKKFFRNTRENSRSFAVRIGAQPFARTVAALVGTFGASAAMAQSSPGAAIAAGLASGPAELGLIFIAVAAMIGLLLVWRYSKKAG